MRGVWLSFFTQRCIDCRFPPVSVQCTHYFRGYRTMADIGQSGGTRARPLSPHLQVYKPLLIMMMSISHRVTGAALYFGTVLLVWWLAAAAAGPDYFAWVNVIYGSILGRLILFGFTWALMFHMLGGIRHLIWDLGKMIDVPNARMLAMATLVGSFGLTLLAWIFGYAFR